MSAAVSRDHPHPTHLRALDNLLLAVSPVPYKQGPGFLDQRVVACLSAWADQLLVLAAHHLQVALVSRPVGFPEERHRLASEDEEDRVCHRLAARHRDLEALRLALVALQVARLLDFSRLLASKVALLDREGAFRRRQDLEAGR